MGNSKAIKSFFAIFALFAIVFLLVPQGIQAQTADNQEEEPSFLEKIGSFFTTPVEAAKAVRNLLANLAALVALFFSGVVPILGIAVGITYAAMMVLGLVATGLFIVLKGVILATMSISVIPGANVEVVTQGWQFSRDFVSLFFIVILVFIGLATILRWRDYQVQKTLPPLIIMALLINFSGVAVGLVVDMGNIATASIIQPLGDWGGGILQIIEGQAESLWKTIVAIPIEIFSKDPLSFFADKIGEVFAAGARALFFLLFVLIMLVVLLLFLIRVPVLWLLTILAPFAFAAYILPQTRSIWKQWWQQLFQWSFIGAPMAFFILLSVKVASIPQQITGALGEEGTRFGNILIDLIQPLFIMFFLVVGFFISVTFVPKGAQFVTSAAQRGLKGAGTAARQQAWKGAVKTVRPIAKRAKLNYQTGRRLGFTKRESFGSAFRGARADIKRVSQPAAAAKGTWKAVKESASAGWKAAIKAKKKKKGFECPKCKHKQSKDNDFCENCGQMF